eukprot:gene8539-7115_t
MAAQIAAAIFDAACGCAAAAGRGDHAGLRRLVEVLCLEVALCNQIGHSRPEEGSEHYLCYLMEALVPEERFTHAELVGPGLL